MANPRGIYSRSSCKDSMTSFFSDEIVLLVHTHDHMQAKTESLRATANSGMEINIQKTKSLQINARNQVPLYWTDMQSRRSPDPRIWEVSLVSMTGGTYMQARTAKVRHVVFAIIRPIWKNRCIHVETKLRIFNSTVFRLSYYMVQKPGGTPKASTTSYRSA